MTKTSVILLGAGKIGDAILNLLSHTSDYRITVADRDPGRLDQIRRMADVETVETDIADSAGLARLVDGHAVALSAAPYFLTPVIAAAAKRARAHYFDLTEDVASTRAVRQLAEDASTAFVPQCGLAPGFVSIVAHDLAQRFDTLRDVHMRVGALPLYPSNALKYNLTWSTDGLINEYCNPCEAICDGRLHEVPALEEVEHFSLDGIDYEAFNTSGGLGSLCATLAGRVRNLNYKTVRYPGHRDIIKTLVRDLQLGRPERRAVLKDVLENAIPMTRQDVVLVYASVCGERCGRLEQETWVRKIYSRTVNGTPLSAIQITTAAGICAMLELLLEGKLPRRGLVRQEDARLGDFLANRFGGMYAE